MSKSLRIVILKRMNVKFLKINIAAAMERFYVINCNLISYRIDI